MFKKPNRRVLALIAAASLWVLIGASIAIAQSRFNDVPADHTFTKEIDWMAEEGITRGCNPAQGNTNFCPERTLTRGEMSAFLYRLVNNLDGIAGPQGPEGPAGPAGPAGDIGPEGPQGPAGVTDVTVRRLSAIVEETTVHCEPGEIAIGGGGVNDRPGTAAVLIGSYPYPEGSGSTPTGWTAVFDGNAGGTGGTGTKAYAICATIGE